MQNPYKYRLFTEKSRINDIDLRVARQITKKVSHDDKHWPDFESKETTFSASAGLKKLRIADLLFDRRTKMNYSPRSALRARHQQLFPCIGYENWFSSLHAIFRLSLYLFEICFCRIEMTTLRFGWTPTKFSQLIYIMKINTEGKRN